MRIRVHTITTAAFVLGCASGGSGTGSSSVPVYLSEAEVPCEYEVIRTVGGFATVTSIQEYERARERVLGRQGAQAGADAVVIPDDQREPGRGNVGLAVRRAGGVNQPTEARFSGQAIRFTAPDCRPDA